MKSPTGNQMSVFAIAVAVILSAAFRLLLEIPQVFVLKYRYLLEISNWMEVVLFILSITFAWIFSSPCLCPKGWQWQLGTVAVFLAWIDLMLFFDKFPWIGIYVLMFVKVVSTFIKALFVSSLLVIAFALTLYMLLYEPSIRVCDCSMLISVKLQFHLYVALTVLYCWSFYCEDGQYVYWRVRI